MATNRSDRLPLDRPTLADLTIRLPQGDLLDVEPADLGPGAPATAALEHQRGLQPDDASERGDR